VTAQAKEEIFEEGHRRTWVDKSGERNVLEKNKKRGQGKTRK
jgi:hypothetical protein